MFEARPDIAERIILSGLYSGPLHHTSILEITPDDYLRLAFVGRPGAGKRTAVARLMKKHRGRVVKPEHGRDVINGRCVKRIMDLAGLVPGCERDKDAIADLRAHLAEWMDKYQARIRWSRPIVRSARKAVGEVLSSHTWGQKHLYIENVQCWVEEGDLKDLGFAVVLIRRPVDASDDSGKDGGDDADQEEWYEEDWKYTKWDYIIDNDSTLEAFHSKVDDVYRQEMRVTAKRPMRTLEDLWTAGGSASS